MAEPFPDLISRDDAEKISKHMRLRLKSHYSGFLEVSYIY